jgi:hypothetical protein
MLLVAALTALIRMPAQVIPLSAVANQQLILFMPNGNNKRYVGKSTPHE